MSWKLTGEFIETCSCNMLCPCWFGQADLMKMDRGWCSTSLLVRIREGSFGDTDLSGHDAVVGLHWPGPTVFDANGTGRVYVDESANDTQREALETILQGRVGGGMEVPASLMSGWLPTMATSIAVSEDNGEVRASIGGVGEVFSRRLVNELGDRMTMHNTTFSMAFQFEGAVGELAPSGGTAWQDPDMPVAWEGSSGVVGRIAWSG